MNYPSPELPSFMQTRRADAAWQRVADWLAVIGFAGVGAVGVLIALMACDIT